jgi:hypothetical protein
VTGAGLEIVVVIVLFLAGFTVGVFIVVSALARRGDGGSDGRDDA